MVHVGSSSGSERTTSSCICGKDFLQTGLFLDWFSRKTRPFQLITSLAWEIIYPWDGEWSLVQAKSYLRSRPKIAWSVKMPLHWSSIGIEGSWVRGPVDVWSLELTGENRGSPEEKKKVRVRLRLRTLSKDDDDGYENFGYKYYFPLLTSY